MEALNELALFAGAGGGLLATTHLLKWRTVCYVEFADYPIEIIKVRIRDGYLDDAPIWDDARTFDGRPWRGCVDIVTAGFPCQPFSTAGKQLAENDERNMWPETIRIIREVRPAIAFLENVPGLISSGYIFVILDDLAQAGYKAFPPIKLAASDVGANHKRQRIWIVAYATGLQFRRKPHAGTDAPGHSSARAVQKQTEILAHAASPRGQAGLSEAIRWKGTADFNDQSLPERGAEIAGWWATEPPLGRVANGVARRMDRLKAIGNGQVPAVVATVWGLLTEERYD